MSASYLASDVERYYLRVVANQEARILKLEEALKEVADFFEEMRPFGQPPLQVHERIMAALAKAEGK